MIEKITGQMALKQIIEMHSDLGEALSKMGFDTCCSKMSTLEDACKDKGKNLQLVLEKLNQIVDQLNLIESIEEKFKEKI
ncbi:MULTISPECIES: hypothetical protein [Pseudothermotoga]|jgi:iron-sulfur cluster repair protein YtfE (RIC family)|uniref:DUF1858 domain-containing protein n=1 Tax=Pseudothermotoga lettingae (strain ATCC BAA-301 / DSM 14385 / NBRC 107922 / TMO) TaxID=416591 RepID=A8F771_PSELT|nr:MULTISPECIES: hypothetical protein [Pseudothermotoga]ABV34005.1 hypothetical protein Tlet_1449 [Pseudothermotoga lettingae TMO]MDI3495678.1 hypothetical protein [Pseudothermotoga sp.]MDK2884631.1 hypothetical protein [Pseudothermotoga sp.]GLI49056.1 hypothetical protein PLETTINGATMO_12250 [Pseudothermotoga lettingae TMO]HBJ81056.1 hypothetical protein [Pseudothermotoga sp.]